MQFEPLERSDIIMIIRSGIREAGARSSLGDFWHYFGTAGKSCLIEVAQPGSESLADKGSIANIALESWGPVCLVLV